MQPPVVVLQVCPCLLLHAPVASHVPAQRPLGSLPFFTAAQVWVPMSQLVHEAAQSEFAQHPAMGMHMAAPFTVHDLVVPVHA